MQPQQQTSALRELSNSSFISMFVLYLFYLVTIFMQSSSSTGFVLKTVTVSFPIILSAYVVRRHKASKVCADDLLSHFVFGAVAWFGIEKIILTIQMLIILCMLIIHRVWVIYRVESNSGTFVEAAKHFVNESFTFFELLWEQKQPANPPGSLFNSYPSLIAYIIVLVCLMAVMISLANTISVYYLARRSLHTVITKHNIREPIGVRAIFNYTIMGVLGFRATTIAMVSASSPYIACLNEVVDVIAFIGAAMFVAFEYVEFVCFNRQKRIVRAFGKALMYLSCDQALMGFITITEGTGRDMQFLLLRCVTFVVRSALCGAVTNSLRKRYIRVVNGNFE